MALTFASGSRAVPHSMAHDDVHCAVHDAFMPLPPYTRIREGEVYELGLGVSNCSHRARSRPLSETSESVERVCEATSAEGTVRSRIPWDLPVMEEMMFEKVSRLTRRTFFKCAGTAVATTALLGQNTLSTYAASSSSQEALQSSASGVGLNVVLVHGSFVDASSWSKVVALLQAQQYNALAVQIPLTSLADDIAVTRQALASISGPTILVGHSYAGMVITNAGTNVSNLIGLVYAAAYAPEQGESHNDLTAKFTPAPISKHVVPSYRSGFRWVDPPAFPPDFIQDVPLPVARVLAVSQKPFAPLCFSTPSGAPAWKQVPSWYLVSKNDRTINPDLERFMAKRIGATTIEIASSHASPVSHPEDVFQLILAASRKR
jgi:pimeloyl-ACP methyl ester carboxylesterase